MAVLPTTLHPTVILWSRLNQLAEVIERYSEFVCGGWEEELFGVFCEVRLPACSQLNCTVTTDETKEVVSMWDQEREKKAGKPLWNLSELAPGEGDLSEIFISFQG